MNDIKYMKTAIAEAQKGYGAVNPNPLVGAVVVKNDKIIGIGYHERYGGSHAEVNAIAQCGSSAEGATMYVTLEPCCHHGKTPPCTDAILQSGINHVVVGTVDPNPLISGKGISALQDKGIKVTLGILEKECTELNEVFFHYVKTRMPFVVMKYAMTMDGKIATYSKKSQWITGEQSRHKVHLDRARYSAIMIGVGTVVCDNPMLTSRVDNNSKQPIRIVCDNDLIMPLDSRIVKTAHDIQTIIATTCKDKTKHEKYSPCEIIVVAEKDGMVDLNELMRILGERKIDSVLLEGGATLNWSALQSGIVNKVQAYIAPKLIGGKEALSPIAGIGIESLNDAIMLTDTKIITIGEDILIESKVVNTCLRA